MDDAATKMTLPTASRWAIWKMHRIEKMTYREISAITKVNIHLVKAICQQPGRMIDHGREVSSVSLPKRFREDIEILSEKVARLHDRVCLRSTNLPTERSESEN